MIPERNTVMKSNTKTILLIAAVAVSIVTIAYAIYDFFIASTTSIGFIGSPDGPTTYFIGGHKN